MQKTLYLVSASLALSLSDPGISLAQQAAGQSSGPANTSAAADETTQEVVVTARRRAETQQTVPVSINAFSPDRLERSTVQTLNDVSFISPGLRLSSEGGAAVSSVSLRGLSKLPVGDSVPAVVVYFDEVTLPNSGVDMPTYDLSSVQVLKGPQGTLFGRNVLGGAVLLTSKEPSFDFEGYAKGSYGSYNYRTVEGAVNVPIVDDKLAIRLAGQMRYRDGIQDAVGETLTTNFGGTTYTYNNPAGKSFGSLDQQSGRLSILAKPTDYIKNTLVLDYFNANEQPIVPVTYQFNPGVFPAVFGSFLGPALTAGYNAGIGQAVANQQAQTPFQTIRKPGADYRSQRETFAIINNSRFDVTDNFAVKNIFSYRLAKTYYVGHTDDIPLVPGPIGNFNLYAPSSIFDEREMMSDELQFQGKAFNNKLDYTAGAIASRDAPVGSIGAYSNAFTFTNNSFSSVENYTTQQVGSNNQGVYAQIGLDLSEWTINGLSATLGGRDSFDQVYGCGIGLPTGWVSYGSCKNLTHEVRGHDSNQTSYTMGLDWKIDEDLFLYFVHRRGYRGVAVNSPLFFSQYTTGGTGCLGGVRCPDLRPFQTTKPDTIIDYEVGLKSNWRYQDIKGRFNLTAFTSAYHNIVQFVNYQSSIPSTAPDAPQSESVGENVANLTIRGFELETNVVPVRGLTLSFNAAYTSQEINIESPLLAAQNQGVVQPSPRWSGTLSGEYVLPFDIAGGQLILTADDFYTGRTRPQSGVPLPGYNLLNARADLRNIADKGIDVGFWLRNALDRTYISAPVVALASFPINSAIYGEPRTVGFDVSYRW